MIPTHYKIIGSVVALGILVSGSFWFGVDYQKGKEAKKAVKVIIEKVENHNEDIISLEKHTNEIAKLQKSYEEKLSTIPLVNNPIACSVSDFKRVYDQAVDSVNSMYIEN